jgi:hypothetical protein
LILSPLIERAKDNTTTCYTSLAAAMVAGGDVPSALALLEKQLPIRIAEQVTQHFCF